MTCCLRTLGLLAVSTTLPLLLWLVLFWYLILLNESGGEPEFEEGDPGLLKLLFVVVFIGRLLFVSTVPLKFELLVLLLFASFMLHGNSFWWFCGDFKATKEMIFDLGVVDSDGDNVVAVECFRTGTDNKEDVPAWDVVAWSAGDDFNSIDSLLLLFKNT